MFHPFKCPKCSGTLKNNTWFCPYCESDVRKTYERKQKPHCFIATAAYGTMWHKDIDVLRDFRDDVLSLNYFGRGFIRFYYWFSPAVARVVRRSEFVRKYVRKGIKILLRIIK
jgi:hypothetical protein